MKKIKMFFILLRGTFPSAFSTKVAFGLCSFFALSIGLIISDLAEVTFLPLTSKIFFGLFITWLDYMVAFPYNLILSYKLLKIYETNPKKLATAMQTYELSYSDKKFPEDAKGFNRWFACEEYEWLKIHPEPSSQVWFEQQNSNNNDWF
jgi:hypothetical protein